MRLLVRCLLSCLAILVLPLAAHAQPGTFPEGQSAHIKAKLIAESLTVPANGDVRLVLDYTSEPGWHTYWVNPGEAGLAATFTWNLPDGVTVDNKATRWPAPEILPTLGLVSYGYEGRTQAVITLHNGANFKPGDALPVRAKVDFLICKDVCIPESVDVAIDLKVGATSSGPDSQTVEKAIAALPVDGDKGGSVGATIDLHDGQVALGFPFDVAQKQGAYFFMEQEGVLDPAAPQVLDVGPNGFSLRVKAAGAALPDGVLSGVIKDGKGNAQHVTLTRAPLAAGVRGLGTGAATSATGAGGVLLAAAFALLGGLILNLMPCVFPVLSMKLLGLSRAGHDGPLARRESLVYGAGAILSFVALAAVLLVAQGIGASLGWGFQLQSPWVTAGLAIVMLLVALNMSGVFEVGASLQDVGAQTLQGRGFDDRRPLLSAFLTGVLAVVVAAPCTAPFMATAIGVALAQGGLTAVLIFVALGLGFALPFVALTFVITLVPGVAQRLPRPGPWMDKLKLGLSVLMYAAAGWLVWVFAQQVQSVLILALGLAVIAAAVQFAKKPAFLRPALIASGIVIAAFAAAQPPAPKIHSMPSGLLPHRDFSTATLSQLRDQGTPVFVDLTAAWCVTCKVNERLVLTQPAFDKALKDTGTVYMVGDWTNQDADISRYLKLYGRSGVPLYVYYGPNQAEAVILPQMLNTEAVVKVLRGGKPG